MGLLLVAYEGLLGPTRPYWGAQAPLEKLIWNIGSEWHEARQGAQLEVGLLAAGIASA